MAAITDTLNSDNQVFKAFVFWSTVMVLKMLAMSILTAMQRFKNKVSKSTLTRWNIDKTLIALLVVCQPRGHKDIQELEAEIRRRGCGAGSSGSSKRFGEHFGFHSHRILLRADSPASIPRHQSHPSCCHQQNRTHRRLRNHSDPTGPRTFMGCLLLLHRLHGRPSSFSFHVIFDKLRE